MKCVFRDVVRGEPDPDGRALRRKRRCRLCGGRRQNGIGVYEFDDGSLAVMCYICAIFALEWIELGRPMTAEAYEAAKAART